MDTNVKIEKPDPAATEVKAVITVRGIRYNINHAVEIDDGLKAMLEKSAQAYLSQPIAARRSPDGIEYAFAVPAETETVPAEHRIAFDNNGIPSEILLVQARGLPRPEPGDVDADAAKRVYAPDAFVAPWKYWVPDADENPDTIVIDYD